MFSVERKYGGDYPYAQHGDEHRYEKNEKDMFYSELALQQGYHKPAVLS